MSKKNAATWPADESKHSACQLETPAEMAWLKHISTSTATTHAVNHQSLTKSQCQNKTYQDLLQGTPKGKKRWHHQPHFKQLPNPSIKCSPGHRIWLKEIVSFTSFHLADRNANERHIGKTNQTSLPNHPVKNDDFWIFLFRSSVDSKILKDDLSFKTSEKHISTKNCDISPH